MKKKLIYTMLCSTVMLSGNVLASEHEDTESRIDRETTERRAQIEKEASSNAPTTPDFYKHYPDEDFTPSTKTFLARMDKEESIKEKSRELRRKLGLVDAEAEKEKKRLQEEEKLKKELAQEKEQQKILAEECNAVIEKEKATALEKEAELEKEKERKRKLAELMSQKVKGLSEKLDKKDEEIIILGKQKIHLETEVEIKQMAVEKEKESKENFVSEVKSIIGSKEDFKEEVPSDANSSSSSANKDLDKPVSDTAAPSNSSSSNSVLQKPRISLSANISGNVNKEKN